MPKGTAHLLCGLPASGKTSFAKTLEATALRFSVDEWMIRLYGHHISRELFDERLERCTKLILDLSKTLTSQQLAVILDFGFWKKAARAYATSFLKTHKIPFKFYYFDVPQKELWRRLELRNQNLPEGTFEITQDMLLMFSKQFEEPNADEGFEIIRPAQVNLPKSKLT